MELQHVWQAHHLLAIRDGAFCAAHDDARLQKDPHMTKGTETTENLG